MAWSLVESVWSSESCDPRYNVAATGRWDRQKGSEAPGGHLEIQVEKIPRSVCVRFSWIPCSQDSQLQCQRQTYGKELRLLPTAIVKELRRGISNPAEPQMSANPCRETLNQRATENLSHSGLLTFGNHVTESTLPFEAPECLRDST